MEGCAIAGYNLFWVVEDFLWFVLNPHFGWSKFNKNSIWWHKRWFLGLPLDYWLLGGLGGRNSLGGRFERFLDVHRLFADHLLRSRHRA